ncbi:uncharacterized protein [Ptychodera flava]|uniref:uncharacterized protein n=1 Tax=Ptychodera flava TaxID=63121 RepID=UPI00396AB018
MSNREEIADIFLELEGAKFKRAKAALKDHNVPGGMVERVNDADDMADLIQGHFRHGERKKIIISILRKIKCENVIEKFSDVLSDPPQPVTSSTKGTSSTTSYGSERVSTTVRSKQPIAGHEHASGTAGEGSKVHKKGPTASSKINKGILIVGSEWGTQKGGLSTVNRHIGELAAEITEKVYATALEATREDIDDANSKGITLMLPSSKGAPGKPDMSWLEYYSTVHFPDIKDEDIDIIIGHLPITSTAALNIRDQLFESKKVILFNHVIPEDNEVHKSSWSPEKVQEKENALCKEASRAFVVFSVGPRMYSHFENKYRKYPSLRHELFLPMPDEKFFQITMKKPTADCKVQILTFGRVHGVANLKGYDLVAGALSKVAADYKKFRPNEDAPVWTIRGIPEGEGEQSREYIEKHVTCGDLQYNLYPYGSQDQIREDLQQSHICLMPSRSEPFGMVGLEAIAAGIPVLLTKNSGLAKFLIKYIDRDRANAVILDVGVNDRQREEDIEKWSVRIQQVLNDYEGAFKRAQEIKQLLLKCEDIKKTQMRFKEVCSE